MTGTKLGLLAFAAVALILSFNVWNHPAFDKPSITDIEVASFGKITNTLGTPRLMQFSLRYAF